MKPEVTPRFAIIGAGPAGLYAAEAILKKTENSQVDIIEALPSPFGLVRSGVAPDHFKIKNVSRQFEKILSNERVKLYGNIRVGTDVSIEELRSAYTAIILAHGTQRDRALGIPGEELPESHTATSFVGWYNSHPWFSEENFSLEDSKTAVIIGQGNVAIDVSRILLKSHEELHKTDIGAHAVEELEKSKINEIYLIGRRGPLQIACTDKELKELGEIPDVYISVLPEDLELESEEQEWLSNAPKGVKRNYDILKEYSERKYNNEPRKLFIRFFLSPSELIGDKHLEAVQFTKNTLVGEIDKRKAVPTDESVDIPCDIVLRSVGYLGEGIAGLPFNSSKGIYPNDKGRLILDDKVIPGIYISGWIKRGPSGVIGTNKADSVETVGSVLEDLPALSEHPIKNSDEIWDSLKKNGHIITDFNDWKKIEREEIERGEKIGKSALKFRTSQEMLDFLGYK